MIENIAAVTSYDNTFSKATFNYNLISDELIKNLELILTIPIHGFIAITGVVTNLLSLVILSRLGLKSSIWVGGFALSLTDFIVTTLHIAILCCHILNYVYPESDVDMLVLRMFALGNIRYAVFYISMWITTVISVERCFCVVFPFKVKLLFTRSRCVFAIVVIYCVYISLILPIYILVKTDWIEMLAQGNNITSVKKRIFIIMFTEETLALEIILNTIGGIALSVTSQMVLIVCTSGLIYALRESSRIRIFKPSFKDENKNLKKSELSLGERKLVKVVICLACVLTICNIPRYAILLVYFIMPSLTGSEYKNLSSFIWDISDFFGTLNCSSNFFVYVMVNNNFRKELKQIFRITAL